MTAPSKDDLYDIEILIKDLKQANNDEKIRIICEMKLNELRERYGDENGVTSTLSNKLTNYRNAIKAEFSDDYEGLEILKLNKDEYQQLKSLPKDYSDFKINPIEYLNKSINLLKSQNVWEIAVAVNALTGKRPTEVLLTGKFWIDESNYYAMFYQGQLKKKSSDTPDTLYHCHTLIPAKYLIEAIEKLRNDDELKKIKSDCLEISTVLLSINACMDDKANGKLLKVIKQNYEGIIPKLTNQNLRDVYAILIESRDFQNLSKRRAYCAVSKCLGHIPYDGADNQFSSTTMTYQKFSTNQNVPLLTDLDVENGFVTTLETNQSIETEDKQEINKSNKSEDKSEMIEKKDTNVRVTESVKTRLKSLKSNEKESIGDVIKNMLDKLDEYESSNIGEEKSEMMNEEMIEEKVEQIVEKKFNELEKKMNELEKKLNERFVEYKADDIKESEKFDDDNDETEKVEYVKETKQRDQTGNKLASQTRDKVIKAIQAIKEYNSLVASCASERWEIIPYAIQKLTGSRKPAIDRILDEMNDDIVSHHINYGIEKSHNRIHHKEEQITDYLSKIE